MPDLRPAPLQLLRKTAARVRARGPGEVAALIGGRVREAIASADELVVLARPAAGDSRDDREPRPDGAEVRAATGADAEAYGRDIGTDSPATFRARLSPDTECFVVVVEDRFVHATWCTTSAAWTRELGGYLHPPAGDAYVYESFTSPSMRGRGIYPLALRGIARLLAPRGIGRIWVAVEAGNGSSLRAVEKAGFSRAFTISFERRWGRLRVERAAAPTDDVLRLEAAAT